ncbi:hypothetical protein ETB97_005927 [Aspergillus alliaceus]|uniref:Uncharacterized protein n=1 Tax=Petromyces alliaceus TaxID=209559 RepID=A0A8H5ZV02_PETAA|nr:hypothetical protein ETB97_005927 [Aspergillus burnettii]
MSSPAQSTDNRPSFGDHHAILNLDRISVLIGAVKDTTEGQALVSNYSQWNDAVHQKPPRLLTIFSTLSFASDQPQVQDNTPFARLIAPFGTFENGSPEVQIDRLSTLLY